MINPETIQTVIETARIEEVVSDFVSLKKRGANLWGNCPFHNEKTPSFSVSPAKGIFKCFGCGKAGTAVGFVMEHEKLTFPEAIRYLAHKYNIEVAEEKQTDEQIQAVNERESLMQVSAFAQKYFSVQLLQTDEGKSVGLSYFREREITDESIAKFQLGYCNSSWDDFTKHALAEGYKLEFLDKTGLTIVKPDEKKQFDRFRGRVMFPIQNLTGRVIGFGGRIMSSDKTKAKYINSPESEIYNKSHTLYGIFQAKNAIVSSNNCFLVEGYTDVISLHQAGIHNVVASSGTSLTHDQIKLIRRFTPNITILYDGDFAGIKASFRGIDMILEQGMNVRIVLFPDGEDPDSFARKHRSQEVIDFIDKEASDFITFKTNLLLSETGKDPIKKANLIKEIVHSITLIPDKIVRTVYIRECSSILNIEEQVLNTEVNKLLRQKVLKENHLDPQTIPEPEQDQIQTEPEKQKEENDAEGQEREIIRLLLTYGNDDIFFEHEDEFKQIEQIPVKVALFIVNDLSKDEITFENPVYQFIYEAYLKALNEETFPDKLFFLNHNDTTVSSTAVELLFTKYEVTASGWEKNNIFVKEESDRLKVVVEHSLLAMKARKVEHMLDELQQKLKIETDGDEMLMLLQQFQALKSISMQIQAEQLGRVITK
ncbi:MAG: DNA primase [Bacteroidota bacterium]|nr:DNA primase [Bacteroidota bacterium]